jgi:hypothetical protein
VRRRRDFRARRALQLGQATVAPPARQHRRDAERAAEREGGEHDEHHRGAPLPAEEPLDGGVVLVVQREGEQHEEDRRPHEPGESAHRGAF